MRASASGKFDVADRLGRQNPLVHLVLDPNQLLLADGRRIGEVEPQPVVVDLRALLQGVLAEVLLQGVMEQVRGRVGAADALAALGVDPRGGRGAEFDAALAQMAAMQREAAVDLRVDDLEVEAGRRRFRRVSPTWPPISP